MRGLANRNESKPKSMSHASAESEGGLPLRPQPKLYVNSRENCLSTDDAHPVYRFIALIRRQIRNRHISERQAPIIHAFHDQRD